MVNIYFIHYIMRNASVLFWGNNSNTRTWLPLHRGCRAFPCQWRPQMFDQMLEAILSRSEITKQIDDGYMVQCPAHDDHDPSLHITVGHTQNLYHCFAGCTYDQIAAASAG